MPERRVAPQVGTGYLPIAGLQYPRPARMMLPMDHELLSQHRLHNQLQSLLLVGTMAGLMASLAWILAGAFGAWLALGLVVFSYALNPVASPRLVMALYRGRRIHPDAAPRLYAVLGTLAQRAGLPRMPGLVYIPSRVMNAFTTGTPDESAIAVSDGLLRRMSLREMEGVLAHEVTHVAHEDTRVMAFADLAARMTSLFAFAGQVLLFINLPLVLFSDYHMDWLPILVLLAAPGLSALAQLALSRNREYEADRGAVELTGDPEGLASALEKMEQYQGRVLEQILMPGRSVPDPSLLRTHPPTGERVRRLLALRDRAPFPEVIEPPVLRREMDPLEELLHRRLGRPRWHRTGMWF